MRKFLITIALQAYAALLTGWQMLHGIRTDEAKYLLNIPYPHPPAVRWFFGLFDGWDYQEVAARFLIATLLVQGTWLIRSMADDIALPRRCALCIAWLFSAAFLLQAGTIMMAPLTALQGLVFLWMLSKPEWTDRNPGAVAVFWIFSLFTAYQAVLFLPIVIAIFWRTKESLARKIAYILFPLLLLDLYTLTNPFALGSMLIQAGKDAGQTMGERFRGLVWLWTIGGSGLLSALGTIGILRSRWSILLSFFLVSIFIFIGKHDYYAILFLPLFIAGGAELLRRRFPALALGSVAVLGTIFFLVFHPPFIPQNRVRGVAAEIAKSASGALLIQGNFGHEWQYESSLPILRYEPHLLPNAAAVVCLAPCIDVAGLKRKVVGGIETWVK